MDKTVHELIAQARAETAIGWSIFSRNAIEFLCQAIEQMQLKPQCGERGSTLCVQGVLDGTRIGADKERERIAKMFESDGLGVSWTCLEIAKRIRESAP